MTELVKISGLSNSSDGGDEGAGILEQEAFISVSSVSMANGLEGALNRLFYVLSYFGGMMLKPYGLQWARS